MALDFFRDACMSNHFFRDMVICGAHEQPPYTSLFLFVNNVVETESRLDKVGL